jgi:hypothetical protein
MVLTLQTVVDKVPKDNGNYIQFTIPDWEAGLQRKLSSND